MYTVKPGETIWSIATKFDISPRVMITANELAGLKAVYSGQSLVIPGYRGKFQREVLAYCENGSSAKEGLPDILTSVSPCWAEINANGSITVRIDQELLAKAKEKQIKVYIHLRSFDFDGAIIDRVLEKTQCRHQLVRNLNDLLEEYHLAGINFHVKNISPHNRDFLTRLVQECALTLRQEGFGVIVTLPPKTGDSLGSYWTHAYDYPDIGASADYVVIEAYDFHWAEGHPGPIAPVFWIKDVLDYALMEIAEEKIILGLPCYGYDWVLTGRNRAQLLTYARVMELQDRHNAKLIWDQDAETPYFYYFVAGEEHQVWFENQESLVTKIDLVKKYHLGGIAFWSLGYEDSGIWEYLKKIHLS